MGDKILLKCWSGCTTEDILNSTNLTWSDLFLKPLTSEQRQQQKQKRDKKETEHSLLILEIANNTRALGEKLSNQDLKLEREAWQAVNG